MEPTSSRTEDEPKCPACCLQIPAAHHQKPKPQPIVVLSPSRTSLTEKEQFYLLYKQDLTCWLDTLWILDDMTQVLMEELAEAQSKVITGSETRKRVSGMVGKLLEDLDQLFENEVLREVEDEMMLGERRPEARLG